MSSKKFTENMVSSKDLFIGGSSPSEKGIFEEHQLPIQDLQTFKNYSEAAMFSLVFNGKGKVQSDIPHAPTTKGKYIYMLAASSVTNVDDLREDDLSPYSSKPQYRNYYIKKNSPNTFSVRRRRFSSGNQFQAQCFSVYHKKYPIFKKIYSATTSTQKKPSKNTFVVIFYEVQKDFDPTVVKDDDSLSINSSSQPFIDSLRTAQKSIKNAIRSYENGLTRSQDFQSINDNISTSPNKMNESFDDDFSNSPPFKFSKTLESRCASPASLNFTTTPTKNNQFQSSGIKRARQVDYEDSSRKECKNYRFDLNVRLERKLLVIPIGQNHVYQYSLNTTKNFIKYFLCLGCRKVERETKSNDTLPKSKATLYEDGQLFYQTTHCCTPIELDAHIDEQLVRKSLLLAKTNDNYQGPEAHDKVQKEEWENGEGRTLRPYFKVAARHTRVKGKLLPECLPGNIAEKYHCLLPSKLKLRWLLFQTEEVTAFGSDLALEAMAHADVLEMDATYSTSPQNTYQYLTIHAFIGEGIQKEWQPVVMAIMNGKSQRKYQMIMDEITSFWKKNSIEPTFKRIHVDYEDGLQNAAKTLAGEDHVFGCLFHYSKALLKFIGDIGLLPYYREFDASKQFNDVYTPIRVWIRTLMALPLVPPKERDFIWHKALKVPPRPTTDIPGWPSDLLNRVIVYMEKEWLSRDDKTWEFFGLGRTKNTNRAEGWNSYISRHYAQKPKLKIFIKDMQMIFSKAEARIKDLLNGSEGRPQIKRYREMSEVLATYETEYLLQLTEASDDYERICATYRHLRRASTLLHEIRNKSGMTMKSGKKLQQQGKREKKVLDPNFTIEKWFEAILEEEKSLIDDGIVSSMDTSNPLSFDEDYNDAQEELNETMGEISNNYNSDDEEEDDKNYDFPNESDALDYIFQDQQSDKLKNNKTLSTADTDEEVVFDKVVKGVVQDTILPFDPPNQLKLEDYCHQLGMNSLLGHGSPLIGVLQTSASLFNSKFINPNVEGDGNCLFRSLSVLLTGNEDNHWTIRIAIYRYIVDYGDDIPALGKIVQKNIQKDLKVIQQKYTKTSDRIPTKYWGSATHLTALATMLNVNIVVYAPNTQLNGTTFTQYSPYGMYYVSNLPSLYLLFEYSHYRPIIGIQ